MSDSTSETRSLRHCCSGCAIVLLTVAVFLGFLLYRVFHPADRVLVTVSNIDPSTRSLYFVVDRPSGPEEMSWYLEKVTPFTMKPSGCSATFYNPRYGNTRTRAVQWINGRRYGVVVGSEEEPAQVFWFSKEEMHLHWNWWPRSGGRASVELPDKEKAEKFPDK